MKFMPRKSFTTRRARRTAAQKAATYKRVPNRTSLSARTPAVRKSSTRTHDRRRDFRFSRRQRRDRRWKQEVAIEPTPEQVWALVQKGRGRGFVTEIEILQLFPRVELFLPTYEGLLDALDRNGISLIEISGGLLGQKAEKKEHDRRHQYVPYDFRCCKHMPRLFTAPLGTVRPRKSLLQRKRKYSTFRWIALANLPRGSAKALYVRVRSTSLH